MKMNVRYLIVAALLTSLSAGFAADITGKITLKGTPPPEKELPLDPQCSKLHTTKPTTRFYVVGSGGELADVFVYIKDGLSGKTFEAPAEPAVLDQKGCEYTPYVFGVQTKQKLLVKNSDPVLHNVHTTPSKESSNKESNRAQPMGGKDLEFVFDNPEVFLRFKCDVHPWMFSYAGVVTHPFHSTTGKDGTFKIKNVPAGKYVIEAYHRKGGKLTKEITVGADNVTADFTMEVKTGE
ncbi:MAG: hypothetical protein HYY24_24365 [Verrucomicrobia bacterium]|nr:hypothetical protein [Verrucomicrobiota bacterium]